MTNDFEFKINNCKVNIFYKNNKLSCSWTIAAQKMIFKNIGCAESINEIIRLLLYESVCTVNPINRYWENKNGIKILDQKIEELTTIYSEELTEKIKQII